MLGTMLGQLDRTEDAITEYAKAIELDSSCVEAYLNWGALLENSGKTIEAKEKYMAALEVEPDNPVIKALLVSVQSDLQEDDSPLI